MKNLPSWLAVLSCAWLIQTAAAQDSVNHTIRKIAPSGAVTTVAGIAGQSGFANGPASSALFSSPLGIKVATNGTIFISDCGNHLIRAVSWSGLVTTLAGNAGLWGS